MAAEQTQVHADYAGVSQLAKYPFEPYWPSKKLRVCVTGAGGFIASHLAKRLKSEGHYVIACDWKRNEHFSVSAKKSLRTYCPFLGYGRMLQHANSVLAHIVGFGRHYSIVLYVLLPQEDQFCDEFHLVDLRLFDNCKKVCQGCDHVFNLAADMGGMGFIQSNHSVILYNNTMISYNMLEAARQNGVTRWV